MCNLCSSRLFLVLNPCCCCDLRCGVMWIGIFEIIIGLISLYFPSTFSSIEWKFANSDRPAGALQDDIEEPVFDIVVPWSNSPVIRHMQRTGCYTCQIVMGIVIIIAANGLGGHNFFKFLVGSIWLIIKVILFIIMLNFVLKLRATKHPPLQRYALYILLKMVGDIYFFIVIRYWTMDCYDTFRYNRATTPHTVKRRLEPIHTKSALKSDKQRKSIFGGSKVEKTQDIPQVIKEHYQKRKERDYHEIEAPPVWDRKNDVIFYGEDYTDWDPYVFHTKWEILNEIENSKGKRRKSMAQEALEALQDDNKGNSQQNKKTSNQGRKTTNTNASEVDGGGEGNDDGAGTETAAGKGRGRGRGRGRGLPQRDNQNQVKPAAVGRGRGRGQSAPPQA